MAAFRTQLLAALAAASIAWPAARAAPPGEAAFEAARLVPPDATLAVRVRDARGLRSTGSVLPAQAALLRLADERVLGQAWDRLAGELGVPADELLDRLLGADAIYAERAGADGTEWTLVARTDQGLQDLFVARLAPAIAAGGRCDFARFRLVSAWRPPYVVFGSSVRPRLFEAVLERFDAPAGVASLAQAPDVAPALAWDPAPIEVVLAHGPSVGGATALSFRPVAGEMRVRHRSRFDRPPFHVAAGAPADAGLARALEGGPVAVLAMNPWRGPLDPSEPVDALLAEGGADESMRANFGARQAIVVESVPLAGSALVVPSFALAIEVADPALAGRQWDAWARRFVAAMARRSGSAAEPGPASPVAGVPRHAGASAFIRDAFAAHPFSRGADLHWATVTGTNGSWQLLASDAGLLARVRDGIASARREPDPGGADEVGTLRGDALGAMMRSWLADPAAFAPGGPEAFGQAVALASDIASAAPEVRWRAWARGGGVVESEIRVVLPGPEAVERSATAAPNSAGPGQ